jgi:hypothetical protein
MRAWQIALLFAAVALVPAVAVVLAAVRRAAGRAPAWLRYGAAAALAAWTALALALGTGLGCALDVRCY